MDDIKRKVRTLRFWRLTLSSAIDKTSAGAGRNILYRLYILTSNVIAGYDFCLGTSKNAFKMMKDELTALQQTEAFHVYSKLDHSLQEPVVDEETYKNIFTLEQVLDYFINQ